MREIKLDLQNLGLQVGQLFRFDGEECYISSDGKTNHSHLTIKEIIKEKELITWIEPVARLKEINFIRMCEFLRDGWIAKDEYRNHYYFYRDKPSIYKNDKYWGGNSIVKLDKLLNFLKIKEEIIKDWNKQAIQIKNGKPYLLQVIDGVILEQPND